MMRVMMLVVVLLCCTTATAWNMDINGYRALLLTLNIGIEALMIIGVIMMTDKVLR